MACKVRVKVYDETGKRVYVREVSLQMSDIKAGKDVEEYLDLLVKYEDRCDAPDTGEDPCDEDCEPE